MRHVCNEDFCPICDPRGASAYAAGRNAGGAEAEKFYQECISLRTQLAQSESARARERGALKKAKHLLGVIAHLDSDWNGTVHAKLTKEYRDEVKGLLLDFVASKSCTCEELTDYDMKCDQCKVQVKYDRLIESRTNTKGDRNV